MKIIYLAFVLLAFTPVPPARGGGPFFTQAAVTENSHLADKFLRTELYFGMAKKEGTRVTDSEWDEFLRAEVTPRFPDGFTVLEGYGQFRDASSNIVREGSRVLIVLYPRKARRQTDQKIEEIRILYKRIFAQESVLRMDFKYSVNVSF